jgi:molybdate transport system ATP-binding protein
MSSQQTESGQPNSVAPLALVALEHVDAARAGTKILHDVTWTLEAGRHWGIVGDNGSGKSTFLALIAGNLWPAPDAGTRRYDFGHGPQTDAIEARRCIALVGAELQDRYTRWGWNFSAEQVVLSGLYRTDVPRQRPAPADLIRVHAMLRELDLMPLAGRPFLELSRGEQRRVLIARALAFRPRVLLLDEPANGLDRRSRAALDTLIARAAERCTVVCTAHTAADLPSAVTDVLRLAAGRVAAAGPRPSEAASETTPADLAGAAEPAAGRSTRAAPAGPVATAEPGSRGARAEPAIVLEHVDVWLERRRVLADVSWTLAPGQHWLILGTNGAGKSTLLKLLHGQLRPALGGSVRWPALGDPRNIWRLRRLVGFVSSELQANYLYPASVRHCIASGFESSIGLTRGLSRTEHARVDELLERFELTGLAERAVSRLSYGQMHRTLLARTLVNRPRVLLLDEPWEGLDVPTRRLVVAELTAAMAEGTQLVCASHLGAEGLRFTHELTIAGGAITTRSLED